MLVFVEGGKPENRKKNPRSKARTNNKLNPCFLSCEKRGVISKNNSWLSSLALILLRKNKLEDGSDFFYIHYGLWENGTAE